MSEAGMILVLISGWTPLHESVLGHNYTIAETLLRAGALVNSVGHEGITPLQDAVQLGNFKVCTFNGLWTSTPAVFLLLLLFNHGLIFVTSLLTCC